MQETKTNRMFSSQMSKSKKGRAPTAKPSSHGSTELGYLEVKKSQFELLNEYDDDSECEQSDAKKEIKSSVDDNIKPIKKSPNHTKSHSNVDDDWTVFEPKNKKGKVRVINNTPRKQQDFQPAPEVDEPLAEIVNDPVVDNNTNDKGDDLHFENKWHVWVRQNNSTDWSIKSYKDKYCINSISTFWKVFNNFHKLDHYNYNFFIMKEMANGKSIEPTWEAELNKKGATCSLRIDITQSMDLMQQACFLLFNESLIDTPDIINGISYSIKNNWAFIKIWVKVNVDISDHLPDSLLSMYPKISIQHKGIVPENN
jgi:hypothetical protein